jgi:hypothetical protein
MNVRDVIKRDAEILQGSSPAWRRLALIFSYALVLVTIGMSVDLVRVDHVPLQDVVWIDAVVMVVATGLALVARSKSGLLAASPVPGEDRVAAERANWHRNLRASAQRGKAAPGAANT